MSRIRITLMNLENLENYINKYYNQFEDVQLLTILQERHRWIMELQKEQIKEFDR